MLSSEKDHKKMILLKLQQSIIFKVAQVNAEITGSISEIEKKMSLVRYETFTFSQLPHDSQDLFLPSKTISWKIREEVKFA